MIRLSSICDVRRGGKLRYRGGNKEIAPRVKENANLCGRRVVFLRSTFLDSLPLPLLRYL